MDQDKNVKEINSEKDTEGTVRESLEREPTQKSDVPLFLRESSDGQKGNAQDEKDKSTE